MQFARIFAPIVLTAAVLACSGGSGGTFSVLDGVYDDAPTHGYEPPGGPGGSSSGASGSSGGRDGGNGSVPDAGGGGGGRPFACGTVMQCTTGGAKTDLTYDCALFRSDGKIVTAQGTEAGTWKASGTTVTITLKGADGGGGGTLSCIPKPAGGPGAVDAGKDTGIPAEEG